MGTAAPQNSPNLTRRSVVVIGGGLSGLTTAWRLQQARPDVDVTVLERGNTPGGTAMTSTADGFTIDWGPSTFASSARNLLTLIHDLGLDPTLRAASRAAKRRYVFSGGQLWQVPSSPTQWLRWPLLPWRARLRPLLEPMSAPTPSGDESVFAFAARRFGDEVADALISPMMLGVTAGDAQNLSLRALAPSVHALDRNHRSVVWALVKQRLASPRGVPSPRKPTASLWGLSGGVQTLTQHLARALGTTLHLRAQVEEVQPCAPASPHRWRVRWRDADGALRTLDADAVTLATPAHAAADLSRAWDPSLSDALSQIPYASVRVIALGYRAADIPTPLDGFGFLARRGAGVRSLGCLWSSSLFPEVAPRGHALLRLILGGPFDPDILHRSDDEALADALDDVRASVGATTPPVMAAQRVLRHVIPQYTLGHLDRLSTIDQRAASWPGLHLCSSAYRGLSMEGCVSQASDTAAAIARSL